MAYLLAFIMIFQNATSVYDFKPLTIDGKSFDFSQYRGKKILIVNTASKCGYTPQYEQLEQLYKKYSDKLVIIGFPANNFFWQEPGSNEEIDKFCKEKYDVTFPMMAKVSVKGRKIDPLFKWLTSQNNPDFTGSIKWNFEKFLIDENGRLIRRFRTKVNPLDKQVTEAIEEVKK
jgi:glutathione peroxidase